MITNCFRRSDLEHACAMLDYYAQALAKNPISAVPISLVAPYSVGEILTSMKIIIAFEYKEGCLGGEMVAHLRGGSVLLGKFVDDDIAHIVNKSYEQMENGTCPTGASRSIFEWFLDGRRRLAATCNLETYIEKLVQLNVTSPDFESKVCQLIDTSTPAEFGAYINPPINIS